ncbi:hypothetical protein TeGR_g14200, partial [Tetraparma gracilis]
GEKIKAQFKGKGRFYPGKIYRDNGDGSYHVKFDDGDQDKNVELKSIERTEADDSDDDRKSSKPKVGQKCTAQFKGKGRFYPGKVAKVNSDGTINVDFDDGDKDRFVEPASFKLEKSKDESDTEDDRGGRSRSPKKKSKGPREGEKIKAQFKGKGRFYPGKIYRDNGDGSYHVKFDDGDQDKNVELKSIERTEADDSDDDRGGKSSKPKVGQKCTAQFKGKGRFYPGKVAKVNSDGTINVDFDDGDKDKFVEPASFKLEGGGGDDSDTGGGGELEIGSKVEARYKGKSKYYPGKISRVRSNGTYDVAYDDGEKEMGIEKEMIKLVGGSSPKKSPRGSKPKVGQKCTAQFKGKGRFYPGKVAKVNSDGTINVEFDDGDKDKFVEPASFKLEGGGGDDSDDDRGGRNRSKSPRGSKPKVGQKCTAQFKGKGRFYPGKVAKVNSDGTINVEFDDGDKDKFVEPASFKLEGGGGDDSDTGGGGELEIGSKVEARYKGKSRYYPGKISRVRSNGTYDVAYDDGEKEVGIEKEMIKLVGGSSPKKSPRGSKPKVGQKCTAQFKGKGRFYPGKVAKVNSDGTINVEFDDGDKDRFVEPASFKLEGGGGDDSDDDRGGRNRSKSPRGNKPKVGQRCTAQFKGKGRFYPGKVAKVNSDGTVNVDFDDGDKDKFVEPASFKLEGGGGSDSDSGGGALSVGSKVECRYKGKSRYYPGKISRVRSNGTYDVDYDDGEKETAVFKEMIRALDAPSTPPRSNKSKSVDFSPPSDKFEKGQEVEAKYRGDTWLPGVVKMARPGDVYDVTFDNGKFESRIRSDLVRAKRKGRGRASSPDDFDQVDSPTGGSDGDVPSRRWAAGQAVEAKYRGKGKWYKGKISRVRLNGNLDIKYDDGDSEQDMDPSNVRPVAGGGGGGGGGSGGRGQPSAPQRTRRGSFAS